ncbi:hypothetical protein IW262DRAFT_185287 [Armillaria fumosa]|nr:hypothetical protein IW262DRAFT_185287 [Armillaria fumosa]
MEATVSGCFIGKSLYHNHSFARPHGVSTALYVPEHVVDKSLEPQGDADFACDLMSTALQQQWFLTRVVLQRDDEPTRVLGERCSSPAINATIETGLSSAFNMTSKRCEQSVANQHRVMPLFVTVAIVEANIGLGCEASKHPARMNLEWLRLACRKERKGRKVVFQGYGLLEGRALDYDFAEKCLRELDRLDIFIENASRLSAGTTSSRIGRLVCIPITLAIRLVPKRVTPARGSRIAVANDVHITGDVREGAGWTA